MTSDSTYGITSYAYDALGRKTYQCQQDNSASASTTCTPTNSYQTWQYSGNTVTFTDESGKQWARTSDALGRLAKVVEDPGSLNLETDYQYDSLGNLASVTQWGGPSGSPNPRTRTFSYDSLSELVQSFNPETGWVCYGTTPSNAPANGSNCTRDYDGNRNLKAKTDARGVQTAYAYDELNRLTSKTYSDGTPTDLFVYDTENITFGSSFVTSHFTTSNVKGRLSVICSDNCYSMTAYSYDPLGRISEQLTSTPGFMTSGEPVFVSTFDYDQAGNLTSLTYPDSRHVTQTWDSGGRLTDVTYADWSGTSVNYPYLTAAIYYADGSASSMTFGNGEVETYSKNKRLQPTEIKVQSNFNGQNQMVFDKQYNYTSSCQSVNNGNIMQILDTLNNAQSQGFCYDNLNRIASFSNGDGSMQQSYTIDPWGNMSQAGTLNLTATFGTDNRMVASGASYDAAGNAITVPNPMGARLPSATMGMAG